LAVLKGRRPGQSPEVVEFRAKLSRGTGREHARFIPVAQCTYRYSRDPNEARVEELFQTWLQNRKYLKPGQDLKSMEPEKLAMYRREYNTMEIDRCYLENEKGEPYSFDFTVETVGSMTVQSIVKRALEAGVAMCQKYINVDREKLPLNMKENPAANRLEGFDYTFEKEDHTLGNLLQSYIDISLMDGTKVTYTGYKVPHPLRDEMVLRIGVAGEAIAARQVLAEAAKGCVAMFTGWLDAWKVATGEAATAARPTIVRGQKVLVKKPATGVKKSSTKIG
jgi:DNA-directed RNA polymerase subunit L